ncbi:MAG: YeeE/YedE thiosulfate transporter family protein [Bacillota bacterium]|nr:YeeE/YedE thiosulfate transporter family protein [Bacillota bacterium]
MESVLAVVFGIGFGYILQRVGALDYHNILNALRLRDLTIPKFMLLSVAITAVGVFTLRTGGLVALDLITANPVGNVLGGLIFGVGFALAGYCPGTSIGAMAEGKRDARWVVAGGLVGVLAYALLQKWITPWLAGFALGKISLVDYLPVNPLVAVVGYSLALALAVYVMDAWERARVTPGRAAAERDGAGLPGGCLDPSALRSERV